jgi:DNA adenine methylase
MNTNKSLLRYPGGKARAAKILVEMFPKNVKQLFSPFFGGGSVEIEAASRGVKVCGADIFAPVAAFWQQILKKDPSVIVTGAKKYLGVMSRDVFYKAQGDLRNLLDSDGFHLKNEKNKIKAAVLFFVINRSSFSGSTLSGGMSPGHQRFTQTAIDRVKNFSQSNLFDVSNVSWVDSLKNINEDTFLYLDPPYLIDCYLYGCNGNTHRGFDHVQLCQRLKELDKQGVKWMLSYNNCDEIKRMYSEYKKKFPSWKYGMSNDKDSKEILILNY